VVSGVIPGHGKCIKQLALSVVKNAKFHSNLQKANLFIAENATEKEEGFNSVDN